MKYRRRKGGYLRVIAFVFCEICAGWRVLGEQIPVLIFRRDGGGIVDWPGDVQRRVVPANAAFVFGEPVVGGFVEEVCGI